MKTIGIKLADGTFYPILEEGSPEKKEVNLTTVKDNQTTVQVDLYRSEDGTMQNAEYVDSLEIKNLVKHPNGEPDIALDISIDENNELQAELHDPETGKNSQTLVSLVSKSLDELNVDSDITGADIENSTQDESSDALDFSTDDFNLDESLSTETQEGFDDDVDFDPNSLNVDSMVEETPAETFDDLDFDTENFDSTTEEKENDDVAKAAAVGTGLGLLGAAAAIATNKNEQDDSQEIASQEDLSIEENASSGDDFNLDDFSIPEESELETNEENTDLSFSDEPIVEDTNVEESTVAETTNVSEENGSTSGESFYIDDLEIPDDFDTNDFPLDDGNEDTNVSSNIEDTTFETEESSLSQDLNSDDDFNLDDFSIPEESGLDSNDDTDTVFEPIDSSTNAGLDFSDILDEETKAGNAAGSSIDDETKKKTKGPVIICVVCSIICILAVLLILFVIPTKFNLLNKNSEQPSSTTEVQQKEQEETPQVPEPKYEAKENEIVVAPAEAVVPETPKEVASQTKNISYKIKWGDTLWDISKSYYNNPWKYPKIAKYNGIKNPDHIISGTVIVIPAE